jgi:hypothetical protein
VALERTLWPDARRSQKGSTRRHPARSAALHERASKLGPLKERNLVMIETDYGPWDD